MAKPLYVILGLLSLILGIIGIALPLLPTTPFILLSAFCFSRSSDRLYNWLTTNETFGPVVLQWQQHRVLSTKVKKRAIAMIVVTFSITVLFFVEIIYVRFLLLFIAVVLITYLIRLPSQIPAEAQQTAGSQKSS
ncbi:MAG: YbaN family protein [Gammaproteobacteria bacterium]|jgi:uncharacterized membrane protein YbaN (DUF454 family)